MTQQEKEIVAKASVPMTVANGLRWFFMIIALFLVLFLFSGISCGKERHGMRLSGAGPMVFCCGILH